MKQVPPLIAIVSAAAVMVTIFAGCSGEEPDAPPETKQPGKAAPDPEQAIFEKHGRKLRTVKRVINGRTIELSGGEKVRLIGVYAPDTDEHFGDESVEFIRKTLQRKKVWLEYDKEGVLHKDKRFRTLAYVHYTVKGHGVKRVPIGDTTQDLCVPFKTDYVLNEEIIRRGYRPVDREYDFKHKKKYVKLEREARKEQKGIWKPETGLVSGTYYPEEKLQQPKEIIVAVYGTEADRKYHVYECLDRFGVRSQWMLLNDAKAQGYTPCEKCNPPQ